MADQSQIPDRRPVIYGVLAVVVLLVATALFWPTSEEAGPDTMVLTPESLRVAEDSAPVENPATTETVSDDELASTPLPNGEKEIVDAIPASERSDAEMRVEGTKAEPGSQTRPPRPQALPQSAIPNTSHDEVRPTKDGDYVLNVGSFGERANADRLVLDLQKKGIPGRVQVATSKGSTVYRVRVGYFATSAQAAEFGRELEQKHGIKAWTSLR